jgi:hypothetical protein
MTRRDAPAWLPLALLVLALLVLFHRLLAGETLFWGLPALQFYPWREFAFGELRAGHLPTWNPYLGAGAPLLANYQTAVFYPPNWLFLLLPGPQAMSLIAVLHVVWAGLGMWMFAGALGLAPFGRGMSTLSFALSGYLIARLGSFPTADAAAWIPWIFWLAQRVLAGQHWRDAGWLGLAFGMQLLAGHAQTAWYSSVGVGLYVLWRVLWRQREQRLYTLALAGVGMVLGLAVAAAQLIPTVEYLGESQRSGGLDYETLTNLSYHPARLITLLSPDFYGTPADGSYITKGIYFEDAAYIGFVPFVSAIAAVAGWMCKRKNLSAHPTFSTVPFWVVLALVALVVAMGKYNPGFRFLYDHVPTFNTFREPVRWLILTTFSLSVLAGIGTQHWGRGKWVVFWSRLAAAGGGGMAVMALGFLRFGDSGSKNLEVLSRGMVVLGCWIAVAALFTLTQPVDPSPTSPRAWRTAVLVFVALDLAWAANGLNPTVPAEFFDRRDVSLPAGRTYWYEDYRQDLTFGSPENAAVQVDGYFDLTDYRRASEGWQAVRASLLPDINMLDRVPSLNNNDPLLPSYYSEYVDLIERLGEAASALLQAAGVSRTYGTKPTGWQGESPYIAPEPVALARLVPQADWYGSDKAIKEALLDPAWNPAQTVILAGEPAVESDMPDMTNGKVVVLESGPTTQHYRVTSDGAAYLVIAQTWYPGWTATLNGKPASLYRANLAFQAVAVPPGEMDVTLAYHLNHWRWGVGTTALGLLAALELVLAGRVARARHVNL